MHSVCFTFVFVETDLKIMAILASEFEKLFWVDADAFLLRNFDYIESQTTTGTLFWRDMHKSARENPVWHIADLKPFEGLTLESGILLVDKATKWRMLHVTAYLNQKQNFYYAMLWGDKDTFYIACEVLKEECTLIPYGLMLLGKRNDDLRVEMNLTDLAPGGFTGYTYLQPDMEGRPVCVHLASGGKNIGLPLMKKGKRMYSFVRSYDPNKAHLSPIGKMRDVVVDEGDYYAPLYPSEKVIGPFEETLLSVYQEAQQFLDALNH